MKTTLLAALALLSVGCASAPAPYLATVNDEAITGPALKAEFKKIHGGHEKFLGGSVEARKFLEKVVDRKLLVQEAYRLGLQDQPGIRAAAEELQEKKEVELLLKDEIDDKAVPSKEEVAAAWEKETSVLRTLRQIAVETREEAEALHLELLRGADFSAVARACSISQSRLYGGLFPQVGWGTLDPAVEKVAFALAPGETSPPIQTAMGWEIFRLEDEQSVTLPDPVKAYPRIEGILKRRKVEERKRRFSASLFETYRVVLAPVDRSPAALGRLLETEPGTPVATWDGGQLTIKEFLSRDELAALGALPARRVAGHVEELLRQTVNDALARREAKARKLGEVPAIADAVREFREELMERALYADFVLRNVAVTDDEVRAAFEANRADWITPERRRLAHVVLKTKEEALEVKRRLLEGAVFAEVVKARTLDKQTAGSGGDLGWIVKRDVPPDFLPVLKMAVGEVSEPVETRFGWHLVKVVQIAPPVPMTFEAAREDVRKKLLESRRTKARAEWVSKLRAAATIEVNTASLEAFAKENSAR